LDRAKPQIQELRATLVEHGFGVMQHTVLVNQAARELAGSVLKLEGTDFTLDKSALVPIRNYGNQDGAREGGGRWYISRYCNHTIGQLWCA
jgi:hypothetical protein